MIVSAKRLGLLWLVIVAILLLIVAFMNPARPGLAASQTVPAEYQAWHGDLADAFPKDRLSIDTLYVLEEEAEQKLAAGASPANNYVDSCTETITAGSTINGEWSESCGSTQRSGRYARYYTFAIEDEREVSIALESVDADAYVYLLWGSGTDGAVLYENDDVENGNTDSRIQETLTAGTYTIEATTYTERETGSFELAISAFAATTPTTPGSDDACLQEITVDAVVSGDFTENCDSASRSGHYARYYTFAIETEVEVSIALESTDADTYLYLLVGSGTEGSALYENDDAESGNTNSRIQETVAAGTYTIEATTYAAGATGSFNLTVSLLGNTAGPPTTPVPENGCVEAVAGDQTISGNWAEGCESSARVGSYARYYTFTLADQSTATITLESGEADTYLYLRGGDARSGPALHENDDVESGDTDSQIQEILAAGAYTVEATTYSSGIVGSFALIVTFTAQDPPPQEAPSPEDFPWVQDGLTDNERWTLFLLQRIERSHPEIAQVLFTFPWLADDITRDESFTVSYILSIADLDSSLAALVVSLPWIAISIAEAERWAVKNIFDAAREDLELATSIAELLSMEGPLRQIHGDFALSILRVSRAGRFRPSGAAGKCTTKGHWSA